MKRTKPTKLLCSMLLSSFLTVCFCTSILTNQTVAQNHIIQDLKNQLAKTSEDSVRLRLHFEIASNFHSISPEEILLHSDSMQMLAQRLKRDVFIYRAKYFEAIAYYLRGDFKQAEEVLTKVDASGFFHDDLKSLIDVYNLMGTILTARGKMSQALHYQFKALQIARDTRETDRELTALSNIAEIYTDNLDTVQSMAYYQQALELAESIADTISIAVINNNLSGITQDPDLKLTYAHRALDLFQILYYPDGIAHSSNELARGLRDIKSYDQALPYVRTSIEIWMASGFKQGLAAAYSNIGIIYGYLAQHDSARKYFDRAIQLFDSLEDKTIAKDAFVEMADMYEAMGHSASAMTYLKRAMHLKDMLYSAERAQQLAVAETDFETQEKEQRLAEQRFTIARQRNTQKNVFIGGALIILMILGWLQYLRYRHQMRRKDADLRLQLEKTEAEKLRELDRLKTNFFTNISHEFRTPLTLIQTPLNEALKKSAIGRAVELPWKHANNMAKSTTRLLQLVNRLLDLTKLEAGKMQLSVCKGDLAQLIRSIGYGFESMALDKQINYHVMVTSAPVLVWHDGEKIEHILYNLLANAFKFTPRGGRISLEARFEKENVAILVCDNGIGISREELPRIFERFFSNSQSGDTEGDSSGVGLALTRELVRLHNGTIDVESQVDLGTTFTLSFPTSKEAYDVDQVIEVDGEKKPMKEQKGTEDWTYPREHDPPSPSKEGMEQPLLLIVEDNKELREYITAELTGLYRVETAIHGTDGLAKAVISIPDLIITDVMMPEMDGIELCRRLRQKVETSHIPIIMLTAKADREGRLSGLAVGADDYLTKPFDQEELRLRVKNLVAQRLLLKKKFSQHIFFKPSEIAANSVDEAFLNRVLRIIEENMEDTSFGVEDLGKAISLSRSQLHRKLKAIADKSPNELIRNIRLQRAHDLLQKNAGTASEVAYRVGFNSLSYFSKCFKDQFDITPSEVETMK